MDYLQIAEKFNIKIKNHQLFIDAFTHSSYANEHKEDSVDYERIEFIGDGVLDLVVADLIFNKYPNMKQGEMTKLRAALVCSSSLSKYAEKYEFATAIRIGGSTIKSGGPNQKILEDVFEAFIGATYLDQGYAFTKKMILNIIKNDLENFDLSDLTDYKSKLQEYLQSSYRGNVIYRVIDEFGLDHDKTFTVEVSIVINNESVKLGVGTGKNKKQAEQIAAKNALSKKAGM